MQVQLSTSSNQVAALAQQAVNVARVRTDRVDALQQTVRDGNFNVSNEQVAAAMYSDIAASGTNEQGYGASEVLWAIFPRLEFEGIAGRETDDGPVPAGAGQTEAEV